MRLAFLAGVAVLVAATGCSLDTNGLKLDDASVPTDAPSDTALGDSTVECMPGFVDDNRDPADGCEYECTPTSPATEVCDGLDNDCNTSTLDGVAGAGIGDACDGDDDDACEEGVVVCVDGGTICNDVTADDLEVCDGVDNDCDASTPDGFTEIGEPCDGDDADECAGGRLVCAGGALSCDDPGGAGIETCDGADNDCDPSTPDGAADPLLGVDCDGVDSDLCNEGVFGCVAGALVCDDETASTSDVCNGADDDCDPSSADGDEDPALGGSCDGVDTDLCEEGTRVCSGGALTCNDTTSDNVELCNGMDDDCNAATVDGAGDTSLGGICDGPDTDFCDEGVMICRLGAPACNDATSDDVEVCNGMDDDCNPGTADGSAEATFGDACDGPDSDLCNEGAITCSGGVLACNDTTGHNLDICNGSNDDCDASSADGSEDPMTGNACDGPDTDACAEGTISCSGGALSCSDASANNEELCNGLDDDCRPGTADGADDANVGTACDGTDADFCAEGANVCTGGALVCNDATADNPDVCNGIDDDCDPSSPDGADDAMLGVACDGADADACLEGVLACSGGSIACDDASGDTLETCNALDDDCDGVVDEGGACTSCTRVTRGATIYQFCNSRLSWASARNFCSLAGYHLVKVDDDAEKDFIWTQAVAINDADWWIGASDSATEGTFVWTDGSALYSMARPPWGTNQPNNAFGSQDCATTSSLFSGDWNDIDCGDSTRYVCELDP